MDTLVSIDVFDSAGAPDPGPVLERAMGWFAEVERVCSRFDPASELRSLCSEPQGTPVVVSELLFSALRIGLGVCEATDGLFDLTVGARMAKRGFDRNYRTGEQSSATGGADERATWRDVRLNPSRREVVLRRPLLLDLGALAKGLAIDLAGQELREYERWAVYAGGDLLVHDSREQRGPFAIGIRHPSEDGEVIETLRLASGAVCTSGDYERGEHILVSEGHERPATVSCTVVAPTAVVADALSTAAFLMEPRKALRFLEAQGVEGLLFDRDLRRYETRGMRRLRS